MECIKYVKRRIFLPVDNEHGLCADKKAASFEIVFKSKLLKMELIKELTCDKFILILPKNGFYLTCIIININLHG